MINFLLESTVSLIAFLAFYHLFLEREKMHQFNRFYLLFSIVISLIIPFLSFEIIKITPVLKNIELLNTSITSSVVPESEFQENFIPLETSINYIPYILWSVYIIVSFLLLLRFGKNIWKLISKSKSNPIVKLKNANLILVKEKTLPHTFLNSIFINFEDYNNRNIEDELYTHELVHVDQKHTLDILSIEFLTVVFWFNPLFYFYKKAIQLNHEFIADENVIKTHANVSFYQSLLLSTNENTNYHLASNLNYLLTKKRLIMMTKSTSQKTTVLKKFAIIPILTGLIYFFCIEVVAREEIINVDLKQKNIQTNDKDKVRDSYYDEIIVKVIDEKKDTIVNNPKEKESKGYYKNKKKIIVIDTGHGGKDLGATKDDLEEKKLLSEITKKIKAMYSDSDVSIHFTRTEDEFISLKDRTDFINSINPDLLISLHINSSKNIDSNGFEIYITDKADLFDKTKILAEKLSLKLSKTQLKSGGLKTASFWILKNSDCPSMIVELGFISNENDRKFIASEKGQTEISKNILEFISNIE